MDRKRESPPTPPGEDRASTPRQDRAGDGTAGPDAREEGRRRVASLVGLLIARDWRRSRGGPTHLEGDSGADHGPGA